MITSIPTEPSMRDPDPEMSIAEEILNAIRLAREQEKSCEVVINLHQAVKFLRGLGYQPKPFREGVLLKFAKAGIYVHNPLPAGK